MKAILDRKYLALPSGPIQYDTFKESDISFSLKKFFFKKSNATEYQNQLDYLIILITALELWFILKPNKN